MRKIVVLVLALFLLCFCSGCAEVEKAFKEGWEKGQSKPLVKEVMEGDFFEKVADDLNSGILYYRDVRTDVMYVYSVSGNGYGRGAALSIMLCPDGRPLLFSEWISMEDVPNAEKNP